MDADPFPTPGGAPVHAPAQSPLERKSFLVLLVMLLGAGAYILSPFLKTVVMAVAFSVLFHPLHATYLKWTKGRKTLSAFLSVLSVFALILFPVTGVLALVTIQLSGLVSALTRHMEDPTVTTLIEQLEKKLLFKSVKFDFFGLDWDLIPILRKALQRLTVVLSQYSPSLIEDTLGFAFHIFVFIVVLYYLFREGKTFFRALVRVTPIKDQYEHRLAQEFKTTVHGVFYGSFLTALIQAALATAGFYLIGIDGFLVWGVLTFFVSFLPMVGTGAVVAPLSLLLLLQGQTREAGWVLLYGVVVISSMDNIVKPFLMGDNIHPVILFLSVFGGLAVFGPVGLLLAPMLMAMLMATLRIYEKDFSGRENGAFTGPHPSAAHARAHHPKKARSASHS